MLRLTIRSQTPEEAVLEVHGWITGKNVEILEQEGTRLLQRTQCLVLDLNGVRFVDRPGLALLKRWTGSRLELRGGSSFMRTLLAKHGLM